MLLIKGLIAAPGAHIAAISTAQKSLLVAVVGHDERVYLSVCDQDQAGQQCLWRGWCPVDGVRTQAFGPVELVEMPGHRTAAFVTGVDGQAYTTALDAINGGSASDRPGWAPISGKRVPLSAPVVGISSAPEKLDVVVAGNDGGVYATARRHGRDDGTWHAWARIPGLTTAPGGCVTAISRSLGKLDAFVVAEDHQVYTASWDQNRAEDGWRGWSPVASGVLAEPGSRVHAVSRSPERLDVFVVGDNGGIYTAGWYGLAHEPIWAGWWSIPGVESVPGGLVTAVSQSRQKLDVFVVTTDGEVATAAYDDQIAGSHWRGWWPVAGGHAKPGSGVSVAARTPTELHAFVAGLDGIIWTSSRDETLPDGIWRGWWPVPTAVPA